MDAHCDGDSATLMIRWQCLIESQSRDAAGCMFELTWDRVENVADPIRFGLRDLMSV